MIKEPTSVVQAMAPAQRTGMPIRGPVVLALGAALIAWAGSAQAGRSCEDRPLTADVMAKGLNLAARTAKALDAEFQKNGTQVAAGAARTGLEQIRSQVFALWLGLQNARRSLARGAQAQ